MIHRMRLSLILSNIVETTKVSLTHLYILFSSLCRKNIIGHGCVITIHGFFYVTHKVKYLSAQTFNPRSIVSPALDNSQTINF